MKRANLVLHPVRLRIILTFAGHPRLTPKQVAAALPDVPQATIYRHLARLHEGRVLAVAAERRIRGAVERTYVLTAGGASLSAEDVATATRDEHLGYFETFVAGLIRQFAGYLARPEIDLERDGVGYRQVVLNLTDEEFGEMAAALNGAVGRFLFNEPGPGRKPRTLATVVLPL